MKTIKVKAIISFLLLIAFIITTFTGIGLYFSPSGKIISGDVWSFFGFNNFQLINLHVRFGFIMSGIIIVHLFMNYKMFLVEIKALFKK